MSFLRARPNGGSPYHESNGAAEELIRNESLHYTIVKAGMVYGRGDHMLDHLSHSRHTLPIFATVGFREKLIRPLAALPGTDAVATSHLLCGSLLYFAEALPPLNRRTAHCLPFATVERPQVAGRQSAARC
jgi:hypothetical protein